MRSTDIATLAAALRANPESASRVAAILDSIAAEQAEIEAQPVPVGLREPAARH